MKNTFRHTAKFYDVDQHPAGNADVPFYLQEAAKFGSPILELACGTGRIAIPLAEAGHSVCGLDLSREMLSIFEQKMRALPRETVNHLTLRQGSMTDFALDQAFRLILIPFHSFQALESDEEARKCLNCCFRHLTDEGALIVNIARFGDRFMENWQEGLETLESDLLLKNGRQVKRYTILGDLDEAQRLMTFDNLYRVTGTETASAEYRDRLQVRYYEAHHMRKLFHECGFEVTKEWGAYDRTPLDYGDEMIFVCRKKPVSK